MSFTCLDGQHVLTVARSPQPALAGRGGFQPPAGRRVRDWWPVRPRPRQPAQHEEVSFPFCAWSRRGLTASDPATGGHGHVACVQREVGHFQPPCYNWVNHRVNLRGGMKRGTPTPALGPRELFGTVVAGGCRRGHAVLMGMALQCVGPQRAGRTRLLLARLRLGTQGSRDYRRQRGARINTRAPPRSGAARPEVRAGDRTIRGRVGHSVWSRARGCCGGDRGPGGAVGS